MTVTPSGSAAYVADSKKGFTRNVEAVEEVRYTGWADGESLVITHGADADNRRRVTIINTATKEVMPLGKPVDPAITPSSGSATAASKYINVVHTSDTVTTITNNTGGTLAVRLQLALS